MSNQLRAVVTADIRQFQRAMNIVGFSATSAAGVAVGSFAAITASVIAVDKAAISAAKSYETLRLRLQLLAGDSRKGAAEFANLRKFAEESAFSTHEVIDAYVRLRAVTGQKFATDQIENIAFSAKVAGVNVQTMATRVGELVLRLKTGLTGGLLARSLRTFGTAFGEKATLEMVKMAQAGENSEVILQRLTKALGRLGVTAKQDFARSVEGLEKQLGGLVTGTFASLGEAGALDQYRQLLQEVNKSLVDIKDTDAFKGLGESLKILNQELLEAAKGGEFKQFLEDIMNITSVIAKAIAAIVWGLSIIKKTPNILTPNGLITSSKDLVMGADGLAKSQGVNVGGFVEEKAIDLLAKIYEATEKTSNYITGEQ